MSDASFIYQLRSNEENMKYVEMKPYKTLERGKSFIQNVLDDIKKKEVFFWTIETKNSHIKVGTICLWSFSKEKKSAEIGYELLPSHQNKGYANEALGQVITFAKEQLKLNIIDAITHEKHEASIRLLIKNDFKHLGYVYEIMPEGEEGPEMQVYRKFL
jgi:ribosomal-protein-alanine N-acetyltransferase